MLSIPIRIGEKCFLYTVNILLSIFSTDSMIQNNRYEIHKDNTYFRIPLLQQKYISYLAYRIFVESVKKCELRKM